MEASDCGDGKSALELVQLLTHLTLLQCLGLDERGVGDGGLNRLLVYH